MFFLFFFSSNMWFIEIYMCTFLIFFLDDGDCWRIRRLSFQNNLNGIDIPVMFRKKYTVRTS